MDLYLKKSKFPADSQKFRKFISLSSYYNNILPFRYIFILLPDTITSRIKLVDTIWPCFWNALIPRAFYKKCQISATPPSCLTNSSGFCVFFWNFRFFFAKKFLKIWSSIIFGKHKWSFLGMKEASRRSEIFYKKWCELGLSKNRVKSCLRVLFAKLGYRGVRSKYSEREV